MMETGNGTWKQSWKRIIAMLRQGELAPALIVVPEPEDAIWLRRKYPGRILRQPSEIAGFKQLLKEGYNVLLTLDAYLRQHMTPQICSLLQEKEYRVIQDERIGEWAAAGVSPCDQRML